MHAVHIGALDLNLARVLHALLVERNVSRAGRRLGLSQSATSHALARIRDVVGDPLFVRTREGLVPTARAEAMTEPLGTALALFERALLAPAAFDPATAARHFKVAATDYAELLLLPGLLGALGREAPRIDVAIVPFPEDPLVALRRGEIDLVIGVFDRERAVGGTHSAPLLDDRFVCVVREDHPLARGRMTVARFAAARHVQVAPRGKGGGPVDQALASLGKKRHVSVLLPHFTSAANVVAESDLVLTIAERFAESFARKWPLVIVEPPVALPEIHLAMIWQDRDETEPAHRWFRERIVHAAGELTRHRRARLRPPPRDRPAPRRAASPRSR